MTMSSVEGRLVIVRPSKSAPTGLSRFVERLLDAWLCVQS